MTESQISAFISEETKEQVERYADAHGVKKGGKLGIRTVRAWSS